MNFCWITLNVKDMEESLKFYNEVIGLEIAERFVAGNGMEIVMLGKKDGTKVELICNKNAEISCKGLSIGFEVESIEAAMELMKEKNIAIKRGPISPMPGMSFFFIEDPNGVEVQLVYHEK